jgi:hypothetical protein
MICSHGSSDLILSSEDIATRVMWLDDVFGGSGRGAMIMLFSKWD